MPAFGCVERLIAEFPTETVAAAVDWLAHAFDAEDRLPEPDCSSRIAGGRSAGRDGSAAPIGPGGVLAFSPPKRAEPDRRRPDPASTPLTQKIVIATRESRLALWQAGHVKALIESRLGWTVELLGMTTMGDQILDRSLSKVGGKGLFVKELENALIDGRADLAVHSLKDVPMDLPPGFALACVLEREDPRDAFVSNRHARLVDLPQRAVVGTSSLRRLVLLRALRPDLQIAPLRGNLDTRLRRLDEGHYDAIVLAAAGL